MPRVSIIIPLYNRAAVIGRTIESALAQTFGDWEMVVIDDGSTDDSAAVAEIYAAQDRRIRVLRHENNRNANVARNTGFRVTTGEWIAMLDSDDEWHPEKLAKQLARIEQWKSEAGKNPGVVYTWSEIRWLNGVTSIADGGTEGDVYGELLDRFFGWTSSLLIRRDVYEAVNGFNDQIRTGDEYDFSLRASRLCVYAAVKEPLTIIHRQPDSKMSLRSIVRSINRRAPEIRRVHGRHCLAGKHLYWGRELWKNGDYLFAAVQMAKCVALSPKCGEAWKYLAIMPGKLVKTKARSAARLFTRE